ncbi:prepilin-type N-terminal cleavage/methylation domain-containing protein [Elusimicrobium posterum]|uniref:type IV pilin protein n=1 Tax=Elusimicrobium posterum TaxID=3116653 RepID=UPI003C70DE81
MKNIISRHSAAKAEGFTLIELLVVVLIIGILAAIALPQYTKAVEKSRVTEALLNLRSIQDALQRCQLAALDNCDWDALDIDFALTNDNGMMQSKNFSYQLDLAPESPYARRINSSADYIIWFGFPRDHGDDTLIGKRVCDGRNAQGVTVCKSLGKKGATDSIYELN